MGSARSVRFAAFAIILAATALSAYRVAGRTLYWDDFLIPATYGAPEQLSFTGLFLPHDGHLMPGAIALQLAVDRIAALEWWLPATLIVVGTFVSAVLWAASGVARGRPLVLALLCFSPFLGVALGWWSAAINALAWQIACAVALLLLRRTRPSPRTRLALRGAAVAAAVFAGLLFTEKALSILPLLTALALFFPSFLYPRCQDDATRRVRVLTLAPGWLVTAAWTLLYVAVTQSEPSTGETSGSVVWGAAPRALRDAILPGLLGGPWSFERWAPSGSFASPSAAVGWLAAIGAVVLVAVWLFRHGQGPVSTRLRVGGLVLSLSYLGLVFLALALARSGTNTADVITASLHYYADAFTAAVLLCTAAAVQAEAQTLPEHQLAENTPATNDAPRATTTRGLSTKDKPQAPRARDVVRAVLAMGFIASSTATTIGYLDSWHNDKTDEWLRTVKSSLRAAPAPLLSQPVPAMIANRYDGPRVDIAEVARSLPDWPGVSAGTPHPTFLNDEGKLVAADVLKLAVNEQPDGAQCGQRIPLNKPTLVKLSAPLKFGEWTWVLNTTASTPVTLRILTPNGLESYEDSLARAHRVAVPAELNQQHVRVSGGGNTIEVLATPQQRSTPASGNYVCLGAGEIGPLLPVERSAH
ncbi:MAG: hypothetical protein DI609_12350 [Corynebacterium urealyticum]|uniref:Uncharacterized protein n=1 Tax=Corynebacterium urealyticum TaxID=43771 RepID=A0A2W5AT76_9CORY|nr:MAG: hypothetical protein DI609_12350 [Corynebacterium urealyticum]